MQKEVKKYLISVAPLTRISLTRDQSFFYTFDKNLSVGTLVEIPIGNRKVQGVVTKCSLDFPRESGFVIRNISKVVEKDFLTSNQLKLADFISDYYLSPLAIVLKHFVPKRVQMRGTRVSKKLKQKRVITTKQQEKIISKIIKSTGQYFLHITNPADKINLLFSLVQQILERDKHGQVLYLFPELIQTPYFEAFVYHFFAPEEVVFLHSKLSKGEYYKNWRNVKSGRAKIIIGTRSALFAPFDNLKTVIVDEAHDMSHKQWDHNPLFDARKASSYLAKIFNCSFVMTSATPRTVDYYHKHIAKKNLNFISLINSKKANIEVIDMKKERWDKNKSPISRTLSLRLKSVLKNDKQALLFVNRQGMSAFSICSKCRMVAKCPDCNRALVSIKKGQYNCLHCNFVTKTLKKCSSCNSQMEHIGIGTQKIKRELKKIFPKAHIVVADGSTMKKAGAQKKLFRDFGSGKVDIVIGTQMITKGWNSNNVALTAIIDMDELLCLPEYDVNEKAFAFVLQMALRLGSNGKMILQTFQPEDPTVQYACNYDFEQFHKSELELRKILKYPPYTHLIKLIYQDSTKKEVEKITQKTYKELKKMCENNKNIIISQPHSPIVDKVRAKYRKQIIIKNTEQKIPTDLRNFLISQNTKWTIDIDPVKTI